MSFLYSVDGHTSLFMTAKENLIPANTVRDGFWTIGSDYCDGNCWGGRDKEETCFPCKGKISWRGRNQDLTQNNFSWNAKRMKIDFTQGSISSDLTTFLQNDNNHLNYVDFATNYGWNDATRILVVGRTNYPLHLYQRPIYIHYFSLALSYQYL